MLVFIFLLFVIVPLAEIVVFIFVGDLIGVFATIAIVILTAIIGSTLLRIQGFAVLQNAENALRQGHLPVESVIDGVCLLIAGVLLLTPGFITDSVGFMLFIPTLRRTFAKWIFRRLIKSNNVNINIFGERFDSETDSEAKPYGGVTIEGEYEHVNPEEEMKHDKDTTEDNVKTRNSPWRK